MRTILFIVWAFSFLAFGYHALWCEPTLQNIHYTVFFGCVYIITYHEWKEAERDEEFNRRVGKIQNYEEIIDYIENLSKTK